MEEVLPTLKHVRPGNGYVPNFPLMDRVKCNGDEAHPIYKDMKAALPDVPAFDANYITTSHTPKDLQSATCGATDVQWNFEKFLVDAKGAPRKRYGPLVPPREIAKDIEELLKE
eukprot:TRINITY_DN5744_c0_g2_i5.p1 TRINITY_DN5744_c0_g2~~TRINITY_DN5744_c0_g2_i5.p1  ORF type:complete len:114 (+),score=41.75 TRINITY_DN5744_c0_g2_i5:378-719(+)